MLRTRYQEDPENGITNLIGKTDAFFYSDNLASVVVDAWIAGERDKVDQIMKEYVS
jgi:hypothetical protein